VTIPEFTQGVVERALRAEWLRMEGTMSRWFLSISKDGDSTTFLGNLCQCFDAVKSWSGRLNSQRAIKQIFFVVVLGTRGISPPNVCTKHPVISG